ncbi:MAG TPA: saccharopine dehydrogenase C-terminal domain-containing protein [Bacteroidales bacterium]|nr:saccharopine dehydrogenase C-terminal domain-containing protein [Bacteroidales bacterium]
MYKVVVLGAGMVAKPLIHYFLENDCMVTIACNTCNNAQKILKDHPNGHIIYWDANDTDAIVPLVEDSDLVVSLLPYKFHTSVARVCIETKTDMVTTSYVSDEMSGLDREAKEAGIIILNETGLDPGIDHMSAMRIIDSIKEKGGRVEKFWSVCGALPAPENADNPLGYKFSWSPGGVLLASKNDARYLDNGQLVEVSPDELFRKTFTYKIKDIGDLEVYANRDSIKYIDIYGLDDIKTIFRGTFRYRGWCETIDAIKILKLLDKEEGDFSGMSYADFTRTRTGDTGNNDLAAALASTLETGRDSTVIKALKWLGLFDELRIPAHLKSPFDIISELMMSKMMLGDNERDMIVLRHVFLARYNDGSTEVISSQMVDYGSPSTDTSIARTVALPAAIASKLIMEGEINLKGVYRPVKKEIYDRVLNRLEEYGIKTTEEYGLPVSELVF